jgi:hypothetical protein
MEGKKKTLKKKKNPKHEELGVTYSNKMIFKSSPVQSPPEPD